MTTFNKEKFLSELATKLESYCKMKNKDIRWYEHTEWDRDDLDLDISKCKKYCYIDNSYIYQGSYDYCDSCKNILQTTLKPFNLTTNEICIYINLLNDKIKMLEEKIDNLKIEKINKTSIEINNKLENGIYTNKLEEKTNKPPNKDKSKSVLEIKNIERINGIGIVLNVSTKSEGSVAISDKYICIDNTEIMFIIKGFEHNFISSDTINHPYDNLYINVSCNKYTDLQIGQIFI
jgi:hypothetical protein